MGIILFIFIFHILIPIILIIFTNYDLNHNLINRCKSEEIITYILISSLVPIISDLIIKISWNVSSHTKDISSSLAYEVFYIFIVSFIFMASCFLYLYLKIIVKKITVIDIIGLIAFSIIICMIIPILFRELNRESLHYLNRYRLIGSIILLFTILRIYIKHYNKYYKDLYYNYLKLTEYYPKYIYVHSLKKENDFTRSELKLSFLCIWIESFGSLYILGLVWKKYLPIFNIDVFKLNNDELIRQTVITAIIVFVISILIDLIIRKIIFSYYNHGLNCKF